MKREGFGTASVEDDGMDLAQILGVEGYDR
jgi:hypothetical protein